MDITKTDYGKVIKYLSDSAKMYRLSDKARHQDRARQIYNLIWKLKKNETRREKRLKLVSSIYT